MKFRLWLLIAACLWAGAVGRASAQNAITGTGDFRDARWGQSAREVQSLEDKAPIFRDDHLVIYRDVVHDLPADVIYYFMDGRLIMGFAHFLVSHDDLAIYFDDYESIKTILARKIGIPEVENWQMSLPELEEDQSLWGEALGFGLMKVEAGWLLGDSGVALRLSGGNLQGELMLLQFSRDDMNRGRSVFRDYFAQIMGVPNQYFRN